MEDDLRPVSSTWSRRFGQHLETARTRALLSRAQLAARVGTSEETIRRWEHGGARPSPDLLARTIAVLAVDGGEFVGLSACTEELSPLARQLKRERLDRGIAQVQAAALLGVSQPTYAGWEIGRANPSDRYLSAISQFLGLSIDGVTEMRDIRFVVDIEEWPPLGRLIGERRQLLQMTRAMLGTRVGVSPSTVAAWELGYRRPRREVRERLAESIQVDVEAVEAHLPRRQQLSPLGVLVEGRQLRLGLRRSDVARRAGVDVATLSRWVHGVNAPASTSLRRLAAALELSLSALLKVTGGVA